MIYTRFWRNEMEAPVVIVEDQLCFARLQQEKKKKKDPTSYCLVNTDVHMLIVYG